MKNEQKSLAIYFFVVCNSYLQIEEDYEGKYTHIDDFERNTEL